MTDGTPDIRQRGTERWRRDWRLIAAVIALMLLSLLVYQPFRPLPFHVLDFSEFLPILQRPTSLASRFGELVSYYASQGRLNLVPYLFLVLKWEVLGDWTPGWHWLRFGLMWVLVGLTYQLLRRLGCSKVGALCGASVFLFSDPAIEGWTRLTMAEPLGTVILLAACLLALSDRTNASELRLAAYFTGLTIALVLTKEMLLPVMILPIVLATNVDQSARVRPGSRTRTLVIASSIGALLTVPVVGVVAASAAADAYTSEFGGMVRPVTDAIAVGIMSIVPFDLGGGLPGALTTALLIGYASILLVGLREYLRIGGLALLQRRSLVAAFAVLPFIAGLVYLPWPLFAHFYAIPYLVAVAGLIGLAVSAVETFAPGARGLLMVFFSMLVGASAAHAFTVTNRTAADRTLAERVVTVLSMDVALDTIFVEAKRLPRMAWLGVGATLGRYGHAKNLALPPFRDVTCTMRDSLLRRSVVQVVVVSIHGYCERPIPVGSPISARYTRWRWTLPPLVQDSFVTRIARSQAADSGKKSHRQ